MRARRRPVLPRPSAGLRLLLAGGLLLGSVGSCELPKPQLPSLGTAPAIPGPAVAAIPRPVVTVDRPRVAVQTPRFPAG